MFLSIKIYYQDLGNLPLQLSLFTYLLISHPGKPPSPCFPIRDVLLQCYSVDRQGWLSLDFSSRPLFSSRGGVRDSCIVSLVHNTCAGMKINYTLWLACKLQHRQKAAPSAHNESIFQLPREACFCLCRGSSATSLVILP